VNTVIARRRMQFCAGPQTHDFYACGEHRAALERGDVSCFLVLRSEPVREVRLEEGDEVECDFCREG